MRPARSQWDLGASSRAFHLQPVDCRRGDDGERAEILQANCPGGTPRGEGRLHHDLTMFGVSRSTLWTVASNWPASKAKNPAGACFDWGDFFASARDTTG